MHAINSDIFNAYGQLAQTMVPGAGQIAVFNADGNRHWTDADAANTSYRSLIGALKASTRRARPASRIRGAAVQYAFPVVDANEQLAGWLAIQLERPVEPATPDPPEALATRLAPLLKLLAHELAQDQSVASIQQKLDETQQFASVREGGDTEASRDPISHLLDRLIQLLEADTIVVSLPGYHFNRLHSRPDTTLPDIEALRAATREEIQRLVEKAGKPLLVNRSRLANRAERFRFISIALRRGDTVLGTLTAFAAETRPAFTTRHIRLLQRAAPRLRELIELRIDMVTGLPTRAALEHHASLGTTDEDDTRCIVYLDIDRMHAINELFGFANGDEVLRRIATLWPDGCVMQDGLLARHSGDRFVAILDHCTLNHARSWAEDVRAQIEKLPLPEICRGFKLSASIGVSQVLSGESFETVLARAATACRAAKDRGRNRVTLFTEDDRSLVQRKDDLQFFRQIVDALEARRFHLLAQPIVSLGDPQRVTRCEVLVRLIDSHGAELPPAKFLSAAHRYQLLTELDKGVLQRALAELQPFAKWLQEQRMICWLNVSATSIGQADFVDFVRTSIKSGPLPGHCIGFEITESAAINDLDAAKHFIRRVRELGCAVALDDFGTGFSSLAYLKSLAVNAIKIDGAFIRDLLTSARSEAMVVAILDIARQLDLETVAEYVESAEVGSRLAELGVTYGQGYHYARPRPLIDLLNDLRTAAVAAPSDAAAAGSGASAVA